MQCVEQFGTLLLCRDHRGCQLGEKVVRVSVEVISSVDLVSTVVSLVFVLVIFVPLTLCLRIGEIEEFLVEIDRLDGEVPRPVKFLTPILYAIVGEITVAGHNPQFLRVLIQVENQSEHFAVVQKVLERRFLHCENPVHSKS